MIRRDIVALDSGALIAIGKGDRDVEALIREFRFAGAQIIVPAPVLAEAIRGGSRDANTNRLLQAIASVVATTEAAARSAGTRLSTVKSATPPTVDALIVATAEEHHASLILTSDPTDLRKLVSSADVVAI